MQETWDGTCLSGAFHIEWHTEHIEVFGIHELPYRKFILMVWTWKRDWKSGVFIIDQRESLGGRLPTDANGFVPEVGLSAESRFPQMLFQAAVVGVVWGKNKILIPTADDRTIRGHQVHGAGFRWTGKRQNSQAN